MGKQRPSVLTVGIALAMSGVLALAACSSSGGSGSGGADSSGSSGATGGSGAADESPIAVGATVPLSGPAAVTGQVGLAAKAYFDYVNAHGGINGHPVKFYLEDDAYDPAQAVQKTQELVQKDHVVATVGSLGTSTQIAVRAFLNSKKIPQLFIASGFDGFTQDYKKYPYTMGWDAPYSVEGYEYAKNIAQKNPNAKIGILYQADDTGKSYLSGWDRATSGAKLNVVAKESYDASASSVSTQINQLKKKGADTVVLFATPPWTTKALLAITGLAWKPTIYVAPGSNSSSDMQAVAKQAGASDSLEGVIAGAFFKDPQDPHWVDDPGLALYKKVMDQYCDKCDASSVYFVHGMSAAWTFVKMLEGIKGDITSDAIMDAATSLDQSDNPFMLPGITVKTGPDDHEPLSQLQYEKFVDGHFTVDGA